MHIYTSRLRLIALDLSQLEMVLKDVDELEKSLGLAITRPLITDRVQRAIRTKLEKMKKADAAQHLWFTYWLIVVTESGLGSGLIGFKGYPDENGSTEIGYGIDESQQNRGYMTEAVRALVGWALSHPFCRMVTATEVQNPASRRLLEKIGARLVDENNLSSSWVIEQI
jgi:RimJ/RimL family protein N-acetyltransferase